jgi:hypothetical protein
MLRSRVFVDNVDMQPASRIYYDAPDYSPYTVQLPDEMSGMQYHAMEDTPHPNFKTMINRGQLVIGELKVEKIDMSITGAAGWRFYLAADPRTIRYCNVPNMSQWYLAYDVSYGPQYTSARWSLLDDLKKEAMSKAVANLDKSPYSFMEDLLEIRETINLLRHPLQKINELTLNFRKAGAHLPVHATEIPLKRAKRALRGTADVWTTYRFAVVPFIRTITNLSEALTKSANRLGKNTRLRAGGRAYGTFSSSDTYVVMVADKSYTWQVSQFVQTSVSAGIYYYLTVDSSGLAFKYGLRLKDIPKGIWNVVSKSFMIDRVINISRVVQGLTRLADPSIRIEGGYYSVKNNYTVTLSLREVAVPGTVHEFSPDTVVYSYEDVRRVPWIPDLTSTLVPINIKGLVDDTTKIVDLAALIVQSIKH